MAFCSACGAFAESGERFCASCGTPIEDYLAPAPEPAPEPAAPPAPAPTFYAAPAPEPAAAPPAPVYAAPPAPAPSYPPQAFYAAPPAPVYAAPPAPAYAAPAPVYPQQTKKPSGDKTLGVGAFFGLMLLFAIPVLGWIACLVFALVPANKNCKNFARAYLIIILIGIGALVGLYFLLTWLWGLVVDAIINFVSDVTGGLFNELDELRNIFDLFKNLDISGGGLDGLFGSDGLGGLDGLLSSLPSIPG